VKTLRCTFICLLFINVYLQTRAEDLRVLVAGSLEVSNDKGPGLSIPLAYNNSVVIMMGEEARFFRGVELELSAPQQWLLYQGSLAVAAYDELDQIPKPGVADLKGRGFLNEPLPAKLQTVYQIPLRPGHNMRSSPYATVLPVIPPESFPIMFRIMPIVKGLTGELETMRFRLNARPILGDEGAVRISFRYPEQLGGKPFTMLIDDVVVENPEEERLLKEGEHHLMILSDDYRNESRRFLIERAKILDLSIELQDPTPLVIFEAPEDARIFLDNEPVALGLTPVPVEPGPHEVRFQVSDYAIVRQITVQRGKTYRVALAVDVNISESE
jgi:hypothetical protein